MFVYSVYANNNKASMRLVRAWIAGKLVVLPRELQRPAIIAGKYLEGDAMFVASLRHRIAGRGSVVWVIEFGQLRVAERDGSRAECLKNLESEARGVIPRSKRDSREIPEILPRPRRKGEAWRRRRGRGEKRKILFRGSWIGLVSSMDLTVYETKGSSSLKGRSHCKNRPR